jgi:hypothetical protein
MNRIIEFCETLSQAIAAGFLGVGLGVVAALWVIAHGMNP